MRPLKVVSVQGTLMLFTAESAWAVLPTCRVASRNQLPPSNSALPWLRPLVDVSAAVQRSSCAHSQISSSLWPVQHAATLNNLPCSLTAFGWQQHLVSKYH